MHILRLELDPTDDDDDAGSAQRAKVILTVESDSGTWERESDVVALGDYGELELADVNFGHMDLPAGSQATAVVECVSEPGARLLAIGSVVLNFDDGERHGLYDAQLRRGDKASSPAGSFTMGIKAQAQLPESPAHVPSEISVDSSVDDEIQAPAPASAPASASASAPALKHYRASVELRTIRGLSASSAVYLKYTHALFASAPAGIKPTLGFRTSPLTRVPRHSETTIASGFCAHDFAAAQDALDSAAAEEPLVVEVWHRDKYKEDARIGIAAVSLQSVASAPPRYRVGDAVYSTRGLLAASSVEEGEVVAIRSADYEVDIVSYGGGDGGRTTSKVGTLTLGVALECFGAIGVSKRESKHESKIESKHEPKNESMNESSATAEAHARVLQNAWVEFEEWRKAERERAAAALLQKEKEENARAGARVGPTRAHARPSYKGG